MIKNIVFDIGNVLLEFNPVEYLRSFGLERKIEDEIFRRIFKSPYWPELDRGTINEEKAIQLMINGARDLETEIRLVMENWIDMLTPKAESIEVLKELKNKGYNIYVLSNFHEKAFKRVSSENDFFTLLDGEVISYKIKLIKPEREIYEYLLNKYKLIPEETLFIDDVKENIDGAESHGISTFLFDNTASLRAYLFEKKII